jgi:hypothetical protein
MIAALAAAVALAVPGCHAPECLVQLGPGAPAVPLHLTARRSRDLLAIDLSAPALLVLHGGGHELDRWLAPAGRSVHPLSAAGRVPLRLVAVDGTGDRATRTLPALRRARPA